jgi:hypothetical protein
VSMVYLTFCAYSVCMTLVVCFFSGRPDLGHSQAVEKPERKPRDPWMV